MAAISNVMKVGKAERLPKKPSPGHPSVTFLIEVAAGTPNDIPPIIQEADEINQNRAPADERSSAIFPRLRRAKTAPISAVSVIGVYEAFPMRNKIVESNVISLRRSKVFWIVWKAS
jgi:hypothetical protein